MYLKTKHKLSALTVLVGATAIAPKIAWAHSASENPGMTGALVFLVAIVAVVLVAAVAVSLFAPKRNQTNATSVAKASSFNSKSEATKADKK